MAFFRRSVRVSWGGEWGRAPRAASAPEPALLSLCPVPLLASIDKDILALLLRETTHRSEQFIAELSSVLQLYVNVGTDIFTIAKCSQKVGAFSSRGAYFLGTHEISGHPFLPHGALMRTRLSLELFCQPGKLRVLYQPSQDPVAREMASGWVAFVILGSGEMPI